MNSLLFGTSSIAACIRSLPARRIIHSAWEFAREVVITVTWLADAVGAANNNVTLEGSRRTERAVRVRGRAGEDTGCGVAVDTLARLK